jgi:hypothetical protein
MNCTGCITWNHRMTIWGGRWRKPTATATSLPRRRRKLRPCCREDFKFRTIIAVRTKITQRQPGLAVAYGTVCDFVNLFVRRDKEIGSSSASHYVTMPRCLKDCKISQTEPRSEFSPFLGAFAKFLQAANSFVMSVCPYRKKQHPTGPIFM